jgi:hypothetical protein
MAESVLRTVGEAVARHAVSPQKHVGEAETPSSVLPSEHSVQRCRVIVYVCAGISATVVRACRNKGHTEGNDESQRAEKEEGTEGPGRRGSARMRVDRPVPTERKDKVDGRMARA